MYAKTNVCVSSCWLAVCFSVGLEITLWTQTHSNHDDVTASSAAPPNDALSVIFASACITHNALEKWCQKHLTEAVCVCVMSQVVQQVVFLIDWLIRSSLSTVTCPAGQAKYSGVDGDSGIRAAFYSWRTACGGGGVRFRVSSDWIQLLISQLTSGQLHHSRVNCVC